ncbi:MAG TPA: helix-hairpin-helix domain-containing protein [Xanthomonadales bacterium]|nr:helix-hairpin-helix domain-containing protein [Xanthomonadales bacterium]
MKRILISLLFCLLSLSAWAADSVNINQASAQEIADTLQGVGMTKAEEIVRYRDSNGAFKHVDELVNVKGIGLATVDKNRDRISLGAAPAQAEE